VFKLIYGMGLVLLLTIGAIRGLLEAEENEDVFAELISFFLFVPFLIWITIN